MILEINRLVDHRWGANIFNATTLDAGCAQVQGQRAAAKISVGGGDGGFGLWADVRARVGAVSTCLAPTARLWIMDYRLFASGLIAGLRIIAAKRLGLMAD